MTTTFNFEDAMRLGASHLEAMVDQRGRTYFDVFLTNPAEAVTDWPDFVDLPARYLEAAVMVEPVLKQPVRTKSALRKRLFSFIKPDGLAYRPDSPISKPIAELFDQARLLYMLNSCLMADPSDREIRSRLENMCSGLYKKATFIEDYAYIEKIEVYFGGTLIRSLVQAGMVLDEPRWIDFAGALSRGIVYHSEHFLPDGSFSGHVHGHLGAVAGILSYAVVSGDTRLKDWSRAVFDWSRSISTSFGFIPEVAKRNDDVVACETCTLMDYLDLALLLSRHVDGKYWDIVEKAARNHLIESQIRDTSWLAENPDSADEDGIIRKNIRHRMQGAFAGWSAPHAMLAYEEELWPDWVRTEEMRPRYLNKIRAVQNCCAGGGIRALHQVWSNITTFKDNRLDVNMLVDKAIPQARITSFIPFEGRATIKPSCDCQVRFRVSQDVQFKDVHTTLNGRNHKATQDGAFINAGKLKDGDVLEIKFPLPSRKEDFVIGNKGFQQYRFQAEWKGDTVVGITPDPGNAATGISRIKNNQVKLYYGSDAPGMIYQRNSYRTCPDDLSASAPAMDTGSIDWYSLGTQGKNKK